MGHISKHRIRHMIDKGLIDYTKTDTDDFYNKHLCRSCALNKLRRPTYNKSIPKAKRPGARWYMDLTGPYVTQSINGNKYKLALIDSFSNLAYEYYLKDKSASSVYKHLQSFIHNVLVPKRSIDRELGYIYIMSDCGSEFDNNDIKKLCLENGIIQNFSCPYTPETHGKIERLWRTISEMARAMLFESGLPEEWWEHASCAALHIYNRIFTSTSGVSPWQKYYFEQPKLNYLRVFGSLGYCFIPSQLRDKSFQPIRSEGILVGYSDDHSKCYIMYIPQLNVFLTTDKVEFYENGEVNELRKKELLHNINVEVPVVNTSADIDDYRYLVNTLHYDWDDQQIFKTTKITTEKDNIVAYRRAVNKSGKMIGRTDGPIHVYDVQRYTEAYNRKLNEVNKLVPITINSESYEGTHECLLALNAMSNDTDMPVHDRDSSSERLNIKGTGSNESGTPDVINFRSKTLAVNLSDMHSVVDGKLTLKRVHDNDTEHDTELCSQVKCKIPKLYNYNLTTHRVSNNQLNILPHPLASILTFHYFLNDPIVEFSVSTNLPSDENTPSSYSDALLSSEWPKWEIAIQQELEACTRLKVWEKTQRPNNKKLINTRWIFRKKHNPDGTVRYKARLVAKGYMQIYGDDFDMTFSPVARQTSIRTIYAIAAKTQSTTTSNGC